MYQLLKFSLYTGINHGFTWRLMYTDWYTCIYNEIHLSYVYMSLVLERRIYNLMHTNKWNDSKSNNFIMNCSH